MPDAAEGLTFVSTPTAELPIPYGYRNCLVVMLVIDFSPFGESGTIKKLSPSVKGYYTPKRSGLPINHDFDTESS
jgi:hypothetical protein